MQLTLSEEHGHVPVTVLHLEGDLDAMSYIKVIQKSQEVYENGAHYFVIDLKKVDYISSAGLMALHTIALVFAGEQFKAVTGRPLYRALNPSKDAGARKHVCLFGPKPEVQRVLDTVGLTIVLNVFTDLQEAVNSFSE